MARVNQPPDVVPLAFLKEKARVLRQHMMGMASRLGQGYIGQGLGVADLLAAIYFYELRYDQAEPQWSGRDRFVLSTGHYSIALWAALAEAGVIPVAELATYGADESRLDMSTLDTTPGVEMIGGSLGHGLGQAVGMALGQKRDGDARTFCELSDGELQEGSTWEAVMSAAQFRLDNLVALIDCNGIQADGAIVMNIEPVADKWRSFGWETSEIDGNDIAQIVNALIGARSGNGRPKAIVLRTSPGRGVPTIEQRERAHFVRVEAHEWAELTRELEAGGAS